MSLATRCQACGTVFRIAQEQLRASEGWVRCGRCETVFNASELLFIVDPAAMAAADDQQAPMQHSSAWGSAGQASSAYEEEASTYENPSTGLMGAGQAQRAGFQPGDDELDLPAPPAATPARAGWPSRPAPRQETPSAAAAQVSRSAAGRTSRRGAEEADDQGRLEPMLEDQAPAASPAPKGPPPKRKPNRFVVTPRAKPPAGEEQAQAEGSSPSTASDKEATSGHDDEAVRLDPEFLKQARRKALWNHPLMVQALALVAATLIFLLAVQVAFFHRGQLVAYWPGAKNLLQPWCEWTGCTLEAPRALAALSIDSAKLSKLAPGSNALQLQVQLRNKHTLPVAMPSFELTLTDSEGKPVVRKVLKPEDFGVTAKEMPAQSEQRFELAFRSTEPATSGFHMEFFYP
jgi:predicted Zn finger-like uncharacterized protein